MVILLIMVFIGIILYEVPKLIKKKMWRELIAYSVLMAIAIALSIPQALNKRPPNPTRAINTIFNPIAKILKE